MVEETLRMVSHGVSFEQRKIHHVGTFTQLEDQLCSFTSDFDRARAGYSPDRLDALVWALSELLVGPQHVPTRMIRINLMER